MTDPKRVLYMRVNVRLRASGCEEQISLEKYVALRVCRRNFTLPTPRRGFFGFGATILATGSVSEEIAGSVKIGFFGVGGTVLLEVGITMSSSFTHCGNRLFLGAFTRTAS